VQPNRALLLSFRRPVSFAGAAWSVGQTARGYGPVRSPAVPIGGWVPEQGDPGGGGTWWWGPWGWSPI
jgi:hypothetical protein